jgi:hypothetical protein
MLTKVLPDDAKEALDLGKKVYFYDSDTGFGLFLGSPNQRYRRVVKMEPWHDCPWQQNIHPTLQQLALDDPITYEDSAWKLTYADGGTDCIPTSLGARDLGSYFFIGDLDDSDEPPEVAKFRRT